MPSTEKTVDDPCSDHPSPATELRVRLRQLRRERGIAQRQLVTALHLASHTAIVDFESGRRIPAADIIDAYERFFDLPRGALQRLRSRALADRAAREAAAALAAQPPTDAPRDVPRQLPAAISHFTGRTRDLAALDALVGGDAPAVVISAIAGMGGVGKTALAVHWARRVRDRFPDGDLYVNLRGFHPARVPTPPEEALAQFLGALGVPPERIPTSIDERASMYRGLLASRRMLVVLDNARDADQVRPLLPGAAGCVVLVTSRNRLAGLVARDGAQRIMLDVLDPDEARQLLTGTIGAAHTGAEPEATTELARWCGWHPLALRVAAERVVAAVPPSIAAVVAELGDRSQRLEVLAAPEDEQSAVHAVFSWSYDHLSPPAARLFRLLGLHDGPDIPIEAAAALAGTGIDDTAEALAELVAAHMVREPSPGRYDCHDLVQLFAAECACQDQAKADRDAAVRRLTGWYLHSACAGRVALSPSLPPMHPERVDLPSPPMTFADSGAALEWFEAERANLAAATRLAAAHGLDTIGWQLPTAMYGFFDLRKHYEDWFATHEVALECAQRVDDREAQGRILCNVGNGYWPLRRDEEAIGYYRQALDLFVEVEYRQGQAKVLGNIGMCFDHLYRFDEAADAQRRALDIFREIGDRYGEALTLTNMGEMYHRTGRFPDAAEYHRLALNLFETVGDQHGASRATGNLGLALARLGEAEIGVDLLRRAVDGFRASGDRYETANVLGHLGDVYRDRGEPEQAADCWREALRLYEEIGDEPAAADARSKL